MGNPSYVFSDWSSSTTAITFANPASTTTTATISGTGTIAATFVFRPVEQVQISITMSPKGSPVMTVAISGCDASVTSIPADGNSHTITADADCSLTFTAPTETSSLVWEFSNSGSGSAIWTYTTGNGGTQVEANTLYTLDRDTVGYSTSGGGSAYAAPTLSFKALGSPQTFTMTTTGTEVDVDDGSSWTVTNPLTGSGSGERWAAPASAVSGTSSGGATIDPLFYHEFFLTVSGGEGLTSSWYNSSATAQLSVPGVYGRASGSGERVISYSIDGGAPKVVQPTTGMVSISVLMNSAHTLSVNSVTQYQVSLDTASISALSSITPPTIAGDDYWYDQGTAVSLVLNGVWNRTATTGERLASYSLNGESADVSTTGTVDALSGALSSPEALSEVVIAQYRLTTDTGAVTSVTTPSNTGDAGWYDSDTSVALAYYYSWDNTSGQRDNALGYSVNGQTTTLSRSGVGTFPVQLFMSSARERNYKLCDPVFAQLVWR